MKKTISSVLVAALLLTVTSSVLAKSEDVVTVNVAQKDAQSFLNESKEVYEDWKNIGVLQIGKEITLYDFDGNVTSYLFPVTDGTLEHGYIIESAISSHPGFLQATTKGSHPYKNIESNKAIYVGPSAFFSKIDKDNFTDLRINKKIKRKDLKSKGSYTKEGFSETDAKNATININYQAQSLTATVSSSKTIVGVPYIKWDPAIGCSPTAAAMIAGYWGSQYKSKYGKLLKSEDGNTSWSNIDVAKSMSQLMHTTDSKTQPLWIKMGSEAYWSKRGYSLDASSPANGFSNYKTEIDAERPTIINYANEDPTYGAHSVAGIGYQVMSDGKTNAIIHDEYVDNVVIYSFSSNVWGINKQVPLN